MIYKKPADTKPLEKVIGDLTELDKKLVSLKLPQLKPFNVAYLIISRHILARLNKGFFESDKKVVKLAVVFAQYYFQTVERYLNHKRVPEAWRQILDNRSLPRLFQLALAANAHISGDLPLALEKTVDESFEPDYIRLKQVIDLSVDDFAKEFILKEDSLKPLYIKIMIKKSKYWRDRAWENFLKLKSHSITKKQLQMEARLTIRSLYNMATKG